MSEIETVQPETRTEPMKSLTQVHIKSTGTTVDIGLDEDMHPTTLFTTGSVQTQVSDKTMTFSEDWDVTKYVIASAVLREAFERHVTDVAVFMSYGIKIALEAEGYK